MIIDSHHHLWDPGKARYEWMTDEVAVLRRPFGLDDLRAVLAEAGVDASVVVQARHDVAETFEMLADAGADSPVCGVVGWVGLTEPDDVEAQLASFASAPNGDALVGIRHLVQSEPDPDWLRRESVQRSIAAIGRRGLAYDLVVQPPQLRAAVAAVEANPETRFVLDHIGNPRIANGSSDPEWEEPMRRLAALSNVWCKLSGLVTRADWTNWTVEQLRAYTDSVCEWFGEDRLMFGSDWPVCTLAASYAEVFGVLGELIAGTTTTAQEKILGLNAVAAYNLRPVSPQQEPDRG
ncbi:MAG: amidohydrolase family protein [Acidimicrobiales bacterium]